MWPAGIELAGHFIDGVQMTPHIDFGVRKDQLAQTRLRTGPLAPLAAGQVRLEVESFALASKAKKAQRAQRAQRPGVQVVALTRALATSSNFK